MIAFFGMGLLGANFVRALRGRGEAVRVWNRSPEKARALEAVGAVAFDDPAVAAAGATRIHLTLADDASVDAVLERARSGFSDGVVLVDHTTTLPTGTAARAKFWHGRGVAFQHAPVFMGPQNALEATGSMLASGDRAIYERIAPDLAKLTGKLVYLGASPERAASFKLLGNLFGMFMTAGLCDMFALAKGMGISPTDAVTLFDTFNPGATLVARANRIIEADFANPSWELSMARKDVRLMIDEAAETQTRLAVLPAMAAEMDRWIARGHGRDDWMVIAKDSLPTK